MASRSGFILEASNSLGLESGSVRKPVECSASTVCELASSTGGDGSERIQLELEKLECLSVPTICPHPEVLIQNTDGQSGGHVGDSVVEDPALVPNSNGDGLRASPIVTCDVMVVDGPARSPTSANAQQQPDISRLEVVRNGFQMRGFSENVSGLLLEGERPSTVRAYQSAWRSWHRWCGERQINSLSPDLKDVLAYLTGHERGLSYRSINLHRSMLSSTLPKIEGSDLGKHELVCKLLKAIFNRNPPKAKYDCFWDVASTLELLKEWGPNEELNLKQLTLKTCLLLALASFCRVSELAAMSRSDITLENSGLLINLTKLRKTQRQGSLKRLEICGFSRDPTLCPVKCVARYLESTGHLIQNTCTALFVGYNKPHGPVSSSTVARWIKSALILLKVDTSKYSAHSTRGSAASSAFASGTPVDEILAAANWSNAKTFYRFYQRPVSSRSK